ncbi:nucleotidyltransferase family protein [Solwaraspora sp. WMMD406]|uniref:nucleotidyltransferase family protein n=1 Tax=Solwaraspora sp. WMMD406 TaxID=3016095 RepID=UPI002415AC79|nr:nucleotidyltransferase family protein [Solwaraspora sp. WMMD406]MDG4763000.1 nucleotidyltransferase family protein [Solwaraspora sp. WMMD406]
MDATKQLGEILRWAARRGDSLAPPPRAHVEPDTLIEALTAHRLTVRFVDRLAEACPTQDFDDVVPSLTALNQRIAERAELDIKSVARLQALGDQDHPPILLKGFTPHCLTGGVAPHHRAGDIDLLPPDLGAFKELARTLGYEEFQRHIAFHEAGYLVCGDAGDRETRTLLDIHRGFPMFAPGDLAPKEQTAAARVDIDPDGLARRSMWLMVEYADLRNEWNWVPAGSGRVAVLSPELATLIAASHLHKNIHNRAWRYPLANLPLGELADAVDIATVAVRGPEKLRALAERLGVNDAVVFVAHAMDQLFGTVPPALAWARQREITYTRTLWADHHHPLVLQRTRPLETFANLIVREQSIQDYVRELGATPVAAPMEIDRAPTYELGDEQVAAFTHRRGLHAVDASLRVAYTAGTVLVHVTPHQATDGPTRVFFNFGVPVYEVTLWPDGELTTKDCTQGIDIQHGPEVSLIPRTEGNSTIAVRFTASDLGGRDPLDLNRHGHAMVLGVRQQVPGRDVNAATVAALEIIPS